MAQKIILTTTEEVPGRRTKKYLGLVWASSARSKSLFSHLRAALEKGEITVYNELMNEARSHAVEGLVHHAQKMGANAVVGVRLGTTQIIPGNAEVFAYGTAVVVE